MLKRILIFAVLFLAGFLAAQWTASDQEQSPPQIIVQALDDGSPAKRDRNGYPMPFNSEPTIDKRIIVKDDSQPLKEYPHNYVPGTEPLDEDEIRITALGTGNPAIAKDQAAASFMVEVGNGEVFLFDAGGGSFGNWAAMKMPLWKASKIFLTHLHMDHIGDVDLHVDAGQGFGRLRPLEIWGPTGPTPELGVAAYVENLRKIFGWHDAVKRSIADRRGFDIKTHEFDPGLTGEVLVYDNKDVKIFAYPVPHGIFGPVGYRLEYRGLTFSYAGDCEASMNTVKASMEVDVLIHEAMNTPELLMDYMGLPEIMAKTILWTKHTPPEAAGKVFAMAKPRLAVTFHHFNREDTVEPMVNAVRTVWDGPLLISQDLTVINITPQQIVTRMALVEQRPLLTVDMDYMRRMHVGSQIDEPIYQLPRELDESVIRIDFIEDFKKTAKFMMGVKKVVDTVSIAMDKVKETFSPDHEEGE